MPHDRTPLFIHVNPPNLVNSHTHTSPYMGYTPFASSSPQPITMDTFEETPFDETDLALWGIGKQSGIDVLL